MSRPLIDVDEHELAVEVAKLEGGDAEANIAEISQIVNLTLKVLSRHSKRAVWKLLKRQATQSV